MKKSNFWAGLIFVLLGAGLIVLDFVWPTPLGSLMWGFGGGAIGGGAAMLGKYWKWSRPENAAAYQEKLEQERVELLDERKEMLRSRAGRYAYLFGMGLCALSMVLFSILGKLGLVENPRLMVLFLAAFLLLQYAAGIFFYRRLSAKY